jgi:hypothetical protein
MKICNLALTWASSIQFTTSTAYFLFKIQYSPTPIFDFQVFIF